MERPYVDIREQVVDALETTGYLVTGDYPAGLVTLPRIIYFLVTNTYLTESTDRIRFQIDCYASSFEECIDMVYAVNDVMTGLNFHRTYESPDSEARQDIGLYKKTLSYTVTADLIFKRLM